MSNIIDILPIEKIREKANTGTVKSFKLIAIAFSGGHLITWATNRRASGIVSDISIHAEEFLIKKLKKINAYNRYHNIVVLVVRFRRSDNELVIAKPCTRCEKILRDFGIKKIYYTNNGKVERL